MKAASGRLARRADSRHHDDRLGPEHRPHRFDLVRRTDHPGEPGSAGLAREAGHLRRKVDPTPVKREAIRCCVVSG